MKKLYTTIFFAILLLTSKFAAAWTGYDYDSKSTIEISEGNLVREGSVIQFYDYKIDNARTAKILFIDETAGGMRIQLQDLDAKKERTFIMQAQ